MFLFGKVYLFNFTKIILQLNFEKQIVAINLVLLLMF